MSESERADDGVRWLALLLLKATVILVNGIRTRYGLGRGEKCPRCGHAFVLLACLILPALLR